MSNQAQELLARLVHPDTAHIYTEAELDAIEEVDPALAYRLARTQFLTQNRVETTEWPATDIAVDPIAVANALDETRQILSKDGGDIELVAIDGNEVRVRMKGACAGCPNSVLDLRNVVEKIVKARVPGVRAVRNVF